MNELNMFTMHKRKNCIDVLNPTELDRWPNDMIKNDRQLPRGIKIKVTIRDIEYEWIFSLLNSDYLINNGADN